MRRIAQAIGRRLRRLYRRLDPLVARVCARTELMSSAYYFLWNRAFRREHRAVLTGRLRFDQVQRSPQGTSSLLRRNVHRIEKGLIMRPRRDVFAVDYIEETVECYATAIANGRCSLSDAENRWARDVLTEYFDVTGAHPTLDAQRRRFRSLRPEDLAHEPDRAGECRPYHRDLDSQPVTYEQILELAKRRRSVRWFLPQPVDPEAIRKAVAVAGQSPSACNRQPFEFRVFDQPKIVREVAMLPAGTSGFAHNFPVVIVVIGRLSNYFDERDRHLIYIDGGLAAMSLVFALEAQGLASCCINWPDIPEREERAAKILGLSADERPVMFMAVGHPDPVGMVPYSEKKSIDQLCRFNETGSADADE